MDYNGYINGNKVIKCPTEELAKQVIEIAYEVGLSWKGREPREETNWNTYKENTCYSLGTTYRNEITFANTTSDSYSSFEKVPAQEFISWYNRFKRGSTEVPSIKLIKKSKLKLNFKL